MKKNCTFSLEGNVEKVRYLLASGVNPNCENCTAPISRATSGGHTRVMKLLLDAGADSNKANDVGSTPLHWAASNGQTGAVKLLIVNGADPGKANNRGKTPLMFAADYGHTDLAELLK